MAEIIKKGNKTIMKFHSNVKNFKRVQKLVHANKHFKLFIDKNDSIWDVRECEVLSWKTIEKGRKKVNVPDQVIEKRDLFFFNRIKGNPTKVAINKMIAEIDYQQQMKEAE